MSNLELSPQETPCGGRGAVSVEPVRELQYGAAVALGGPRAMSVTRTLPNRARRMVGAWCFVDYYGPDDITASPGMRVPPHPHAGLQTVSWLVSGEVLHRDSLGSHQLITPGQLNLMTAGHGTSHSEESPADHSPTLHGVQLWTALPDRDRHVDPHFEHHPNLPVLTDTGAVVTVIMGEMGRTHRHVVELRRPRPRRHRHRPRRLDERRPRFGTVRGYPGEPLPAPPLPTVRLKPRGRHR
jgi:redox-sensitive bicupin YhaK (pirin superfamily)